MKSTVAKVNFKKEYDTKNGTMYSWHVTMDNGDMGETSTKSDKAPWAQGDEAEYTIEETQYGNKIKKAFTQGGGGGGAKSGTTAKTWTPDPEKETRKERWAKQLIITRLAALNTSASLISAGAGESSVENLTGHADKIMKWALAGIDLKALVAGPPAQKVEAPAPPPPVAAPRPAQPALADMPEDDLPF